MRGPPGFFRRLYMMLDARQGVDVPTKGFVLHDGESMPATLGASIDDWGLDGDYSNFRVQTNNIGGADVTGIDASDFEAGRCISLTNIGTQILTIKEQDAGSAAGNRFNLKAVDSAGVDLVLRQNDTLWFRYDGALASWRLVGGFDTAAVGAGTAFPAPVAGRPNLFVRTDLDYELFEYDDGRKRWLAVDSQVFYFGANVITAATFFSIIGAIPGSAGKGYPVDKDLVITEMHANWTTAAQTDLKIRNTAGVIFTESSLSGVSAHHDNTLDLLFSAGYGDMKMSFFASATITRPNCWLRARRVAT